MFGYTIPLEVVLGDIISKHKYLNIAKTLKSTKDIREKYSLLKQITAFTYFKKLI